MEFLEVFLQSMLKMILLIAVASGGICLGKFFRDKKDAKTAAESQK